jgi:anti-sigma factor RsiW
MIEITDEILNMYIDNELNTSELNEVNEALKNSEDLRKRLYAFQLVHKELKKFPASETSSDFTSLLMKKIIRRSDRKGQKYFIFSISSFFVLMCLVIIGYLTSYIISSGSITPETSNGVNSFVSIIENIVKGIRATFSKSNISIIGLIFSFGIFISAYFFFESHKQAKAKLDKL